MVFPIDNSDVHAEIPSPSVQQADTVVPSAGVDLRFGLQGAVYGLLRRHF
jgi:hypothetical protein